eukprot:CAMPEP_0198368880 /NCGR_PEP_ID=MMETSP1450-20131203/155926_1 /TAXON_ID=753684 ORGANISM="Madagascaria erythrocladiodes, Strain CCMP3234" /NCGR_SAMPLE_ID=MMETSP1450 /ASSEMBLY_ACC=CAM_ASM_001115 /LENGTH=785 /DNA_ID=CAMNT_0044076397 /DNA_START=42 /DNA_END=2399 /DNA_ORIENTATION=+
MQRGLGFGLGAEAPGAARRTTMGFVGVVGGEGWCRARTGPLVCGRSLGMRGGRRRVRAVAGNVSVPKEEDEEWGDIGSAVAAVTDEEIDQLLAGDVEDIEDLPDLEDDEVEEENRARHYEEATMRGTADTPELDFEEDDEEELTEAERSAAAVAAVNESFGGAINISRDDQDGEEQGPRVDSFRVSPSTVEVLAKKNIHFWTPVQAGTFDPVFDGRDVIARSMTGTGKTLAFGVPIIERLSILRKEGVDGVGTKRGRGPSCVILAPTRELAQQVARELVDVARPLGLRVDCFYGGQSYVPQESALRNGLDVLVGTPGRVIDHISRGGLDMSGVKFLVLDEADEMLSMGFSEEVERIMETMPPKGERQTVLFSATVPDWVKNLARRYQSKPAMFDAIGKNRTRAATTVRHCAVLVPREPEARASFLEDIITVYGGGVGKTRSIVFTQTKREADELATSGALKFGAAVLHGDISQRQRDLTLQQFRSGRFAVLVATDVAARGLDIDGVDLVIQYRVPMDTESYIHRAGRTGRAGRRGTAVIMYSSDEVPLLRKTERAARVKFEKSGPPSVDKVLTACALNAASSINEVDDSVKEYFRPIARDLIEKGYEPVEALAGAMALITRKTEVVERSCLTGELKKKTLLLKSNGSFFSIGKVIRGVSKLAEENGVNVRVGKVAICDDPLMAVFDVSVKDADLLLALKPPRRSEFTLEPCRDLPELPPEEDIYEDPRRARGRGGGGYRGGYDRGGRSSFSRNRGYQENRRSRGRPEPRRRGRSSDGGGYDYNWE